MRNHAKQKQNKTMNKSWKISHLEPTPSLFALSRFLSLVLSPHMPAGGDKSKTKREAKKRQCCTKGDGEEGKRKRGCMVDTTRMHSH
jgi:hypothetical protein